MPVQHPVTEAVLLEDRFGKIEMKKDDDTFVIISRWAVPARNKASFEFNNRDIDEALLYKVERCEPQIWIFSRPSSFYG